MQALILSAGKGSRLGSKTISRPKCLLEIGDRHMIEYMLEILAEAGVAPVGMVVGFCEDEIKEVVGIRAEYIENQRWATTNSLYSFLLAKDWIKDSFVVMNSDIIIHPDILEKLLHTEGDAFAYDSSSGGSREHMKVRIGDGYLVSMSKSLDIEASAGENVGIMKFTKETAQVLFEKAEELIEGDGAKTAWFPMVVSELARERHIKAIDISGIPWTEIDSTYDLVKARKEILPAINNSNRARWISRLKIISLVVLIAIILSLSVSVWQRGEIEGNANQILWQTIHLPGLQRAELTSIKESQDWFEFNKKDSVWIKINGPKKLHIDSRSMLGNGQKSPHVLEVYLDDELQDWYVHSRKPSETWSHISGKVSKLSRIDLDIPDGKHLVKIRLLASDKRGCLIRLEKTINDDPELN